jgi:hypothetical protein
LCVDGSGNAFAVSKANEASNEASNPTLYASSDTSLTANPANTLVDDHKDTKISSMGDSLLDDELNALNKSV